MTRQQANPKTMSSISVVVPTRDRPHLLRAALASAAPQLGCKDEIVVVDDGSVVPVREADLRQAFGVRLRVLRNDASHGLAWARHQGVEAAKGDYVVHLDDDDLYAPKLLGECARRLGADPDLAMVFIGVEGFGDDSGNFNRMHPEGVARVIEEGQGLLVDADFFVFDRRLALGLLNRVPMPFQRVMARREAWLAVTRLRLACYQQVFALGSPDAARELIRGTLRDSEWALYAPFACERLGLINQPLYLQRCQGQGGSSQLAMREQHAAQSAAIKSVLERAARADTPLRPLHAPIRASLEKTLFDAAYESLAASAHRQALGYLLRSTVILGAKARHLKLLARLTLSYLGLPVPARWQ